MRRRRRSVDRPRAIAAAPRPVRESSRGLSRDVAFVAARYLAEDAVVVRHLRHEALAGGAAARGVRSGEAMLCDSELSAATARRPGGPTDRGRASERVVGCRVRPSRGRRDRAQGLRRVDACGQRFLHCSAPRLPLAPGSLPPVSPVVVAVARAAAARVIRAAARAQARRKPPKVGEPFGQLTWRGATTQRHVVPIANYAHVAGEAEARGAAADGQQPPRPTTASARRDAAADASHRRARPLAGVAENGSRRRPRRGAVASMPRGAGRAGDGTTLARGGSDVSVPISLRR